MIKSIHIWGSYGRDGEMRSPQGAACSEKNPYEMYLDVNNNIEKYSKGTINNLQVTRLISGSSVGCTFDVDSEFDGERFKMWHVILLPGLPWEAHPQGLNVDS